MAGEIIRFRPGNAGFALTLLRRSIALLVIAAFFGGISIFVNPNSPRYGENTIRKGEIPIESIAVGTDVMWVDARNFMEYRTSHVKGAILVNENDYYKQIGAFLNNWKDDRMVVVYCSSSACPSAENIADRLKRETNASHVFVLHGGWETILKTKSIEQETEGAK